MRDILEDLPHALLPDPTRESEDPGVGRSRQDDDLVRPAAEEDLPIDATRSKRSPLARHVDVVVDPFDPRVPTPIGLALAVEGLRLRSAVFELGHVHQGVERRAQGLRADSQALFALATVVEPGLMAELAIAVAVERLALAEASATTRAWRALSVDILVIGEHARVLAETMRRSPRLVAPLRAVAVAADAALDGIDVGHRLGQPLGLRTPVPEDEQATLRRRLADIARCVAAVDDDDIDSAVGHLRGAGVLDLPRCRELGIDGPALGAAGGLPVLPTDIGVLMGATLVDDTGCTVARIRTRLAELRAAAGRLGARLDVIDTQVDDDDGRSLDVTTLSGTADSLVRGPGGTLACTMTLQAGVVSRLRLRPPDLPLIVGVGRALRGVRLDDVTEVLASFGLRASALDR